MKNSSKKSEAAPKRSGKNGKAPEAESADHQLAGEILNKVLASAPAAEPAPVAQPAKAPKLCPDCGAEIPNRYRVCDNCLEKRRAARKAQKSAQPAAPAAQA